MGMFLFFFSNFVAAQVRRLRTVDLVLCLSQRALKGGHKDVGRANDICVGGWAATFIICDGAFSARHSRLLRYHLPYILPRHYLLHFVQFLLIPVRASCL